MELELKPGIGVLPISFGMRSEEVAAAVGQGPMRVNSPDIGETAREEEFDDFIGVHYDASGRVYSIVVAPGTVKLNYAGLELIGPDAVLNPFKALLRDDSTPFEDLGFVVFNTLGVALTGYHDDQEDQRAMTVIRPLTWPKSEYAQAIAPSALLEK